MENVKRKIVVVGGGNFGLAISYLLSLNKDLEIKIIEKNKIKVEKINNKKIEFLKNKKIKAFWSIDYEKTANCLKDSEIIFISLPSFAIKEFVNEFKNYLSNKTIINLSKGMIENKTIYEFITQEIKCNFISLKGPTFADELLNNKLCAFTILTEKNKKENIDLIKKLFRNANLTFDYSFQIKEGELISCLKNIYAIICGFFIEINNEINFKSLIFTLVLKEIKRLFKDLKLENEVLFKYCGVGDLVGSCLFKKSRNFNFGCCLAKSNIKNNCLTEGMCNFKNLKQLLFENNLALENYFLLDLLNKLLNKKIETKQALEKLKKKCLKISN
jgi:glycerol-3-phosphate dehydrogenase (NAD(P)+)